MKVIQEQLPDSQLGLQIEIPADVSQQTYEKVLKKLIKTANVPGFRKGKVPRKIFLQRFGPNQIKVAALEELVQTSVEKAIEQESIEAIGNYQLTSAFEDLIQQYIPGEPLIVKASVDVPPRVELQSYKGLTIQAEEVKYDEATVEGTLEDYRTKRATLVPIEDRPAQMGDTAVVDFAGTVQAEDGSYAPFEGGNAEDFQLDVEPGGFIEGFVEGIVGMSLDETKDVTVTFPESYPKVELAGKPAVFSITLKELKEKELPDLDDDFAQDVSEFETLAELHSSLVEKYQAEATEDTRANQHEAILSTLVKQLKAEIPETLIRRESNHLVTQLAMQLSRQGIDVNAMLTPEIVEGMRERSRPEALDRLKRTLALGEVAKQESIEVEEADVQARMNEMMAEVQDPQAVDPERLREIVNEELLQEKILDWLLENNTFELVPEGTLDEDEDTPESDAIATPAADSEAAAQVDPAPSDPIEVEATAVVDTEPSDESAAAIASPASTDDSTDSSPDSEADMTSPEQEE